MFEEVNIIKHGAANEANIQYGGTKEDRSIIQGEVGKNILDDKERIQRLGLENAKLEKESRVDRVTGLPNDKPFFEMLKGLEDSYVRDRQGGIVDTGAFIVADLTGLHVINDSFGRDAGGDDYLRSVARSLTFRPEDRAFRLGFQSDEFVLHLHGSLTRENLISVLDRIDEKLAEREKHLQPKYKGIKFGLSYCIASYGKDLSPEIAYTTAVNKLGEAKTSSNPKERVGTVGRLFINEPK